MSRRAQFEILWHDSGKEPRCPPNPEYPDGIDVDAAGDASACVADLPYPAKRIGTYIVKCQRCGISIGLTTAGRPDDPKSVRVPCKQPLH